MASMITHQIYIRPVHRIPISYNLRHKCCTFNAPPSLQSFSYKKRPDVKACASLGPSPPHSWNWWIIGALLSAILPYLGSRLGPLLKLKSEVEAVVETADRIAEAVEKVAQGVEEVADELADHLPEGGKLKDALIFIENVSKEIAKDAQILDNVLDKVEEVEKEMVDSLTHPIQTSGRNEPNNPP